MKIWLKRIRCIMGSYFTINLRKDDRKLLDTAKKEYNYHHPDWELFNISNRKIIAEALKFYVKTGIFKDEVK